MLVYSTGQGVHGFTLDPHIGEFLLSHPNMTFPKPTYYSANHAYFGRWSEGTKEYVRWLQERVGEDAPILSERYIGSLVADFHRNLLKGGVFIYPAEEGRHNGKLRLLYEAAPLAFLAEHAGGYASDGRRNIMDIQPTSLHERIPLYIGNKELVQRAEKFIAELG
jgi:fructose-1,6-bisphosphatase I